MAATAVARTPLEGICVALATGALAGELIAVEGDVTSELEAHAATMIAVSAAATSLCMSQ
jgi:hypothetical protein